MRLQTDDRCMICEQDEPGELSWCTYCGLRLCFDCVADHEEYCDDNDADGYEETYYHK
jgi:hypothetical protein